VYYGKGSLSCGEGGGRGLFLPLVGEVPKAKWVMERAGGEV